MSIKLLKFLNGEKNGLLSNYIETLKNEPRIAWYPSAGTDFRALMFLSEKYTKTDRATKKDPEQPDIFIFTDYFPWSSSTFLDDKIIYKDQKTTITIRDLEELPNLGLPLHNDIIDFPKGGKANNRVIFMNIDVKSSFLGDITYPVIYAFVENEAFCGEIALPNNSKFSHIINIRYGGGLGGGGKSTGTWIENILRKVQCNIYVHSHEQQYQKGDIAAMKYYPELKEDDKKEEFEIIRTIPSESWSNYGDVNWYLVNYK